MMHALGTYTGASRNLQGDLVISFTVDDEVDLAALEATQGKQVALDIALYRNKRSLDANAYFWKLCDEIAKAVGSDKDTIYLMMLDRYGVFETVDVIAEAIPALEPLFRYTKVVDTHYADVYGPDGPATVEMAVLHCYRGSHEYDTKEMSDLISGTVSDAEALGIPTLTSKELEKIKNSWRCK